MKKMCVFYKYADKFIGNPKVEWFVCRACRKKIHQGAHFVACLTERTTVDIETHSVLDLNELLFKLRRKL